MKVEARILMTPTFRGTREPGHAIAARRALPLALSAIAALCFGCLSGSSNDEHALALEDVAPPLEGSSVRVRLVFGSAADLDLYVTGPSQETVYFANTSARDGGALDADLRCDSPAPRHESVVFPIASPGPYRIGVDFPERCERLSERVPYRLVIEVPGAAPRQLEGEAEFGRFDPRAAEFSLDSDVGSGPDSGDLER